ncbi:unnamed protein product, partial [Heterotrigona itama]
MKENARLICVAMWKIQGSWEKFRRIYKRTQAQSAVAWKPGRGGNFIQTRRSPPRSTNYKKLPKCKISKSFVKLFGQPLGIDHQLCCKLVQAFEGS